MEAHSEFNWAIDKSFALPEARLRVLQRNVSEQSVFAADLEPFQHMNGMWIIETSHRHAGEATLNSYSYDHSTETFEVNFKHQGLVKTTLHDVSNRQLTIWRWSEELDMIQVRVRSSRVSMYAQLGGSKTVPMLASLDQEGSGDAVTSSLSRLYRTGELADGHYNSS